MQIKFRMFRRPLSAYPSKKLYEEAAAFAAPLGKERLISISTAGGSVTVWYWSKQSSRLPRPCPSDIAQQ